MAMATAVEGDDEGEEHFHGNVHSDGGLALSVAAVGQAAKPAVKPATAAIAAPEAPRTIAIVDARIVPVTGAVIPTGAIVWTDGKIAALARQ